MSENDEKSFPNQWFFLMEAVSIAYRAHRDQKDKGGEPYMFHVMRVGMSLLPDLDAAVVGVLHDVIEDGAPLVVKILETNMPAQIVEAVRTLTRGEGEAYDDYVGRILWHPLAVKVKLADLEDNLRPDRAQAAIAAGVSESEIDELRAKYQRARFQLQCGSLSAQEDWDAAQDHHVQR